MEWKVSTGLVEYADALEAMRARVELIKRGEAEELVWLLEHPPLYTAGTSAKAQDLLATPFPVYETGRGGQYTYHGPGQRVVYVMLDLKKRADAAGDKPDLRRFVQQLEGWLIATLEAFGIEGGIREGRVGVWVNTRVLGNRFQGIGGQQPDSALSALTAEFRRTEQEVNATGEAKIAALGVRCEKWVTSHGVALNVRPDLSHYAGIVPCGISQFGVTSMQALGVAASMDTVDVVLKREFETVFGAG